MVYRPLTVLLAELAKVMENLVFSRLHSECFEWKHIAHCSSSLMYYYYYDPDIHHSLVALDIYAFVSAP